MTTLTAVRPADKPWVLVVAPVVVGLVIFALWVLVVDVLKVAPRALPSPFAVVN